MSSLQFLRPGIINTLRSEDLDAHEKLIEIVLHICDGKNGAYPSNALLMQITGIKDDRTLSRKLKKIDTRWDREDRPGNSVCRRKSEALEHQITICIEDMKTGGKIFAKGRIHVPGLEIADRDGPNPPHPMHPLPPHPMHPLPPQPMQGVGSNPPHPMQGVPPATNAGGRLEPPPFDAANPPHLMRQPPPSNAGGTKVELKEELKGSGEALFGNLPGEGTVKRLTSSITVFLPGKDKLRVDLKWLKAKRQTVDDAALLDFAEMELRRFVEERPNTKAGEPMTMYGFLGVAFQYRFDDWFTTRTKVPQATKPREFARGTGGAPMAMNLSRNFEIPKQTLVGNIHDGGWED